MISRRRAYLALAIVVAMVAYVCVDLARDVHSLGIHDWDAMESYRLFATMSLQRFSQFPFWDPYACGGFPYWAAPEAGTTVVSPLLPVYLWWPLATAIRVEMVGTLLLGMAGAWALASRFCRDPILKAAVCAVAILNSRWALQAAAGHTWHLYHALLPWIVVAFLRANEATASRRPLWLCLTAVLLALMVYHGAIYPLPQTLLALALYGGFMVWRRKDWRPLIDAATVGALAFCLAAPKLLPVVDTMSKFPRVIKSTEYLDPISYLLTFVSTSSARSFWPYWDLDYGYHEYGIYIGIPAAIALIVALWRSPAQIELRAFRFVGLTFLWLSFGVFGPWILLHQLPLFRSQHVPFRYAYPGLLFLAVVAAAALEGRLAARRSSPQWRRAYEWAIVALVALVAADIAHESRRCLAHGFGVELRPTAVRPEYVQTFDVPADLQYPEANEISAIGTHLAGVGSIRCGSFYAFNLLTWRMTGQRPPGATGLGEPEYRGEIFLESGQGTARFARWSPNEMVVDVEGAKPGDLLVLNQNFDESWRANDMPTLAHHRVNAYRLSSSDARVTFAYRPRTLPFALALPPISLAVLATMLFRVGRRRETAMSPLLVPSSAADPASRRKA